MNIGNKFEQYIGNLIKRLGGKEVSLNNRYKINNNGTFLYCEIDIQHNHKGLLQYIECKYRSNEKVSSEEVSKFVDILKLMQAMPNKQGVMASNTDFNARAKSIALGHGIALYNGNDLLELENSTRSRKNKLKSIEECF